MAQKKARNRRPGQQVEITVGGTRVVLSLWMYRGTWMAETTMKGGRYYQAIGRSDLEVVDRIERAIRGREGRPRGPEPTDYRSGEPARPRSGSGPDRRRLPAGGTGPVSGRNRPGNVPRPAAQHECQTPDDVAGRSDPAE